MPHTILLGAEGCAELRERGVEWLREATEAEVQELRGAFLEAQPNAERESTERLQRRWERMFIDADGRPYWPMVVLDEAPDEVRLRAGRVWRCVRLED